MELVGHYKCIKNENYNKFLKAAGLSFVSRLIARWSKPQIAVLRHQDLYSITIKSAMTSRETYFRLGQEITEYPPGNVIRSVTTMENGRMISKKSVNDKINTISYYDFSPNQLIITLKEEESGVEARRTFRKIPTKL